MKIKALYLAAVLPLLCVHPAEAQQSVSFIKTSVPRTIPVSQGYDVFIPISKYISGGDYESLSAWFADNLEISILSRTTNASRNQARQIVKSFFEANTPSSFIVTHTSGRSYLKYALGELNAGGERFRVTIFVRCKDDEYRIQQFKIDKFR